MKGYIDNMTILQEYSPLFLNKLGYNASVINLRDLKKNDNREEYRALLTEMILKGYMFDETSIHHNLKSVVNDSFIFYSGNDEFTNLELIQLGLLADFSVLNVKNKSFLCYVSLERLMYVNERLDNEEILLEMGFEIKKETKNVRNLNYRKIRIENIDTSRLDCLSEEAKNAIDPDNGFLTDYFWEFYRSKSKNAFRLLDEIYLKDFNVIGLYRYENIKTEHYFKVMQNKKLKFKDRKKLKLGEKDQLPTKYSKGLDGVSYERFLQLIKKDIEPKHFKKIGIVLVAVDDQRVESSKNINNSIEKSVELAVEEHDLYEKTNYFDASTTQTLANPSEKTIGQKEMISARNLDNSSIKEISINDPEATKGVTILDSLEYVSYLDRVQAITDILYYKKVNEAIFTDNTESLIMDEQILTDLDALNMMRKNDLYSFQALIKELELLGFKLASEEYPIDEHITNEQLLEAKTDLNFSLVDIMSYDLHRLPIDIEGLNYSYLNIPMNSFKKALKTEEISPSLMNNYSCREQELEYRSIYKEFRGESHYVGRVGKSLSQTYGFSTNFDVFMLHYLLSLTSEMFYIEFKSEFTNLSQIIEHDESKLIEKLSGIFEKTEKRYLNSYFIDSLFYFRKNFYTSETINWPYQTDFYSIGLSENGIKRIKSNGFSNIRETIDLTIFTPFTYRRIKGDVIELLLFLDLLDKELSDECSSQIVLDTQIRTYLRNKEYLLNRLVERTTKLNSRDRYICKKRNQGETLQDIADELYLSRERVRQIEQKARKTLDPIIGYYVENELVFKNIYDGEYKNNLLNSKMKGILTSRNKQYLVNDIFLQEEENLIKEVNKVFMLDFNIFRETFTKTNISFFYLFSDYYKDQQKLARRNVSLPELASELLLEAGPVGISIKDRQAELVEFFKEHNAKGNIERNIPNYFHYAEDSILMNSLTFIHESFVTEAMRKAALDCLFKKLEEKKSFYAHELHNENYEILINVGIDNEIFLYGILSYLKPKNISFGGTNFKIKKDENLVERKLIDHLLINSAGVALNKVEFLDSLKDNENVYLDIESNRIRHRIYHILDDYEFPVLKEYIDTMLDEYGYIHMHDIYNELFFEESLQKLFQNTKLVKYDDDFIYVLNYLYSDFYFINIQAKLITRADNDIRDIYDFIEDKLLRLGRPFSKKEVKDLCNDYNISNHIQRNFMKRHTIIQNNFYIIWNGDLNLGEKTYVLSAVDDLYKHRQYIEEEALKHLIEIDEYLAGITHNNVKVIANILKELDTNWVFVDNNIISTGVNSRYTFINDRNFGFEKYTMKNLIKQILLDKGLRVLTYEKLNEELLESNIINRRLTKKEIEKNFDIESGGNDLVIIYE